MRRSLLLTVAMAGLTLAGAQVRAQPAVSQTQNPPAPNAQNSQLGTSPNSLPSGGATGATVAPGGSLGGGQAASSGVNTLHPLRPPRHRATTQRPARRHVTHPAASSDASPRGLSIG